MSTPKEKIIINPMTQLEELPDEKGNVIGISGNFPSNDYQLTSSISIRGVGYKGLRQLGEFPSPQNGIMYIDDETGHISIYDSKTNTYYNNVVYCRAAKSTYSVPDNVDTLVPVDTYYTNDPVLSSVPNWITLNSNTTNKPYYVYGYALFDAGEGDREIFLKKNNVTFAYNFIPGIPAVSVPVSGGGGGTVNIPAYSLQQSIQISQLESFDKNDILTLHVRQNSGAPLNVSVYILIFSI